jgi:hypothetical protein
MWLFIRLKHEHLIFRCFHNRKACWRRGRELCFVAFLHSYRCWSKSCFLATFTKKHSLSWSFWCRFWVIFNQRPCKGTWNCILKFIVLLFSVALLSSYTFGWTWFRCRGIGGRSLKCLYWVSLSWRRWAQATNVLFFLPCKTTLNDCRTLQKLL